MADELGTRIRATQPCERIDQGSYTRLFTRDLGMQKLVTDNFTFAPAGTITGTVSEFLVFAVWDPIEVYGTNQNDGFFTIIAIDGSGTFITVDPPPKAEGPVSCSIRTR